MIRASGAIDSIDTLKHPREKSYKQRCLTDKGVSIDSLPNLLDHLETP